MSGGLWASHATLPHRLVRQQAIQIVLCHRSPWRRRTCPVTTVPVVMFSCSVTEYGNLPQCSCCISPSAGQLAHSPSILSFSVFLFVCQEYLFIYQQTQRHYSSSSSMSISLDASLYYSLQHSNSRLQARWFHFY